MSSTSLTLQIGGDISRLRAELAKAQGLMTGFKNQLSGIGHQIGISFGAAAGATALFQGLKYGINTIGDFTHAMQEVRAITNATDKEFEALKQNALELGRTTKFTAKEVAELQIAFGRLGFSNREIIDSTAATLQLATATGEDLAKSADIAGSTLRSFNLDAKEMQRVVDVMAASFNKSALGLDNFGEAMKYVAPVAASANISIEETTAMLGVLADAGIRGSMAGTSLRKIISDVGGESGTLSEKLQKLADKGLTGADAMDEVGRTAYASLLILTKHTDKVNEATKAYQNANGEALKMAELMEDDLWGDVKKLTSALDGFILKFSEGAGPMREFVQGITDIIGLLSDDQVIKFIKGWFDLATLIPRKTIQLIGSIIDSFKAETDAFADMQAKRRKAWEDHQKKILEDEKKKIDENTEAVKKYAAQYRNLLRVVGFKTPEVKRGNVDVGDEFYPGDKTESSFMGINQDEPVPGVVKEVEYNRELHESLLTLEADRQRQLDQMEATAQAAVSMGEAIGGAFEGMISGSMNFAQALTRVTEEIITMYLKQSIAAMIASALKDPSTPFPLAKVAMATAGIGIVKGLFGKIGSGMGAGGGGGGGMVGVRPSEMKHNVGGRIRGYDLALVSEKESYRRSRVG